MHKQTFCHSCPLGKSFKLPFVSSSPLQLIHYDVWCSFTNYVSRFAYYVLFVDDYLLYSWIYPIKLKYEVFSHFVKFQTLIENMFSSKIKEFQLDGGGEYLSKYFQQIFTNMAFVIIKQTFLAHTSTFTYWAEGMHTDVYLIN